MTFVTTQRAAEILRVNERTVRRWLIGGRLAGVKVGGQWRVRGDALSVSPAPVLAPASRPEVYPDDWALALMRAGDGAR